MNFLQNIFGNANKDLKDDIHIIMEESLLNNRKSKNTNYLKTTQYNFYTFFPISLILQFRSYSNLYYLSLIIISSTLPDSPISSITIVLPLVFVIFINIGRELIEEISRYLSDKEISKKKVQVLRDGVLKEIQYSDLDQGDVIHLKVDEEVPADIFLISSEDSEGFCFIDTCNLDGETRLKHRLAHSLTKNLTTPESILKSRIEITCKAPDSNLHSWVCLLDVDGSKSTGSIDQFLYRGSSLRISQGIWGLVLFTSFKTKMSLNMKRRKEKYSDLDKTLNMLVLCILLVKLVLLIFFSSMSIVWFQRNKSSWYIKYYLDRDNGVSLWVTMFFSYFILLSNIMPISLFVTIVLCKFIQGRWIDTDPNLFRLSDGQWRGAHANTTNLNEQLSQVEIIFSDKTGTLTENTMNFKKGDIKGIMVDADILYATSRDVLKNPGTDSYNKAHKFFLTLSLCNTVQIIKSKDSLSYDGPSSDECALVKCALAHGYTMISRSTENITLEIENKLHSFDIISILEFTSTRKMMSILIKDSSEQYILYAKGADISIIHSSADSNSNKEYIPVLQENLDDMSKLGLRTLVIAQRYLTKVEVDAWLKKFTKLKENLSIDDVILDELYLELERDLEILGFIAIEDHLQLEVPETIQFFLNAKVKFWMLTGDKRETAVNIAASSSMFDPFNDYIGHLQLDETQQDYDKQIEFVSKQLDSILEKLDEEERKVLFVIDGQTLEICLNHCFDRFLQMSLKVTSAICCRLTPLQKSKLVGLLQKHTGKTALAIGDGANDVSMIQEGRVGIGIYGMEGSQAAFSADYAIRSFRHLRDLCAVHGRYSLLQNSSCICTSFYKNTLLVSLQVCFTFFCGFSSTTFVDGWVLSFFNLLLTPVPPFLLGCFEKDLPPMLLRDHPTLYHRLSNGLLVGKLIYGKWFLEAIIHGVILFFFSFDLLKRSNYGYWSMDLTMISNIIVFAGILLILGRIALHVNYWSVIILIGFVFSLIAIFFFYIIYNSFFVFFSSTKVYHTFFFLLKEPLFWFFSLFLSLGILVSFTLVVMFLKKKIKPSLEFSLLKKHFRS